MPVKKNEILEEGITGELKRKLEKYFASHKEEPVPPGLYGRVIKEVERVAFTVTLKHTNGNQIQASKILGINRNTLRKKLQELNVKDVDK